MADDVEKVRAFIAVHPPASVIEQLTELTARLKKSLPDPAIRWVKVEQLHLTMQFLGYISRDQVKNLQHAMGHAAMPNKTFTLQAESLGCFPAVSRARVLWVGLTGDVERLQQLKLDLDRALVPLGYKPEERPFHPHLTLARINGPVSNRARFAQLIADHATFSSDPFRVRAVELMQSLLSPKGATYQSLGSFSLQSD